MSEKEIDGAVVEFEGSVFVVLVKDGLADAPALVRVSTGGHDGGEVDPGTVLIRHGPYRNPGGPLRGIEVTRGERHRDSEMSDIDDANQEVLVVSAVSQPDPSLCSESAVRGTSDEVESGQVVNQSVGSAGLSSDAEPPE